MMLDDLSAECKAKHDTLEDLCSVDLAILHLLSDMLQQLSDDRCWAATEGWVSTLGIAHVLNERAAVIREYIADVRMMERFATGEPG